MLSRCTSELSAEVSGVTMFRNGVINLLLIITISYHAAASNLCDSDMCTCDSYEKILCNCDHSQELALSKDINKITHTTTALEIHNCTRVAILSNALNHLESLHYIRLININLLVMEENTFHRKKEWVINMKIMIKNTTIDYISSHTIRGSIGEIIFDTVTIDTINSYAMSNMLGLTDVKIINSTIRNIHTQAFKHSILSNLIVVNNNFRELPSRTFSDLKINNRFIMDGNTIEHLRTSFCIITNLYAFSLINSNIGILDSEAFKFSIKDQMIIKNNTIYEMRSKALFGVTVNENQLDREEIVKFNIWNNTIVKIEPDTFAKSSRLITISFKDTIINKECECSYSLQIDDDESLAGIICIHEGRQMKTSVFLDEKCTVHAINTGMIILIVCIVAILLIIPVTIWLVRRYKKNKRDDYGRRRLNITNPDSNTYRETELYMIVERADCLTTDL